MVRITRSELYHHGILGQKWGKMNGPPYPLDYKSHSATEKRRNSKASIDGDPDTSPKKKGLTDKQKKVIKGVAIGVGVTAAAAATAYAAYKLGAFSPKVVESGKEAVVAAGFDIVSDVVSEPSTRVDMEMLAGINTATGTAEGEQNCTHCSAAYALNAWFGKNLKALGFSGYDEISGMMFTEKSEKIHGRPLNFLYAMFDGMKVDEHSMITSSDFANKVSAGSKGIVGVFLEGYDENGKKKLYRHALCYEKDLSGILTFIDGQKNMVYGAEEADLSWHMKVNESYDLTDASLKDNWKETGKYIFK